MSAQTQPFAALRPNFDTRDIDKNNPLYVDFGEIRTRFIHRIYLELGLEIPRDDESDERINHSNNAQVKGQGQDNHAQVLEKKKKHWLLYGHRGSGKSTELNNLQQALEQNEGSGYLPIRLNVEQELNPGNLSFSDIFVLMLQKMAETFNTDEDDSAFQPLLDILLSEHIITQEEQKAINLEAQVGIHGIFGKLVSQFFYRSENVETWRKRIKQNFSELVSEFNRLIHRYEQKHNKKLFIIIDGTDKISLDDATKLFADSFSSISKINCYCLYTAPMPLQLNPRQLEHIFQPFTLPMIKLYAKHQDAEADKRHTPNYEILCRFVTKRVPKCYFTNGDVIDDLITASGGNPRHLVILLEKAWEEAMLDKQSVINQALATQAQKLFLWENFRWLEAKHIDSLKQLRKESYYFNEVVRELSINSAVLQYNGTENWHYPHPVLLKHHPLLKRTP